MLHGAVNPVSDRGRIYPCDFLPLICDRLFAQAVFFLSLRSRYDLTEWIYSGTFMIGIHVIDNDQYSKMLDWVNETTFGINEIETLARWIANGSDFTDRETEDPVASVAYSIMNVSMQVQ